MIVLFSLVVIGATVYIIFAELQHGYYLMVPIMGEVRVSISSYSWLPFAKGIGVTLIGEGLICGIIIIIMYKLDMRAAKKRKPTIAEYEEARLRRVK
jgi:hypothetical protein